MANNLRKYKFTSRSAAAATANEATTETPGNAPSIPAEELMERDTRLDPALMDLKTEILSSIKVELAALFQNELSKVVAKELSDVKDEIMLTVRSEIAKCTAAFRSELAAIQTTVSDVEQGLSGCSDDITALQNSVQQLEKKVGSLQDKCVDMEGRMRRCNIRLLNISEESSSDPASVSKLLREILKLDKDVLVDRSHRTSPVSRMGGKPRPIIAKLHYYQDCVDILRRARDAAPLHHKGATVSIFPDYPPTVAHARSAFNEVRKLLRGRENVRYGLLHPAQLRITHDGIEKRFRDATEAMAYVRNNIL